MNYDEIELIDNQQIHNFELWVEGKRSFIDYRQKEDTIYLVHTEVPVEQGGRGIAAALVEKTLKFIEAHRYKLVPMCEYVKFYLKKHPEWERIVKE